MSDVRYPMSDVCDIAFSRLRKLESEESFFKLIVEYYKGRGTLEITHLNLPALVR